MLKNKTIILFVGFILIGLSCYSINHIDSMKVEDSVTTKQSTSQKSIYNIIGYKRINDTTVYQYIATPQLYQQGWDTLFRTEFWKKMMTLSSDSCVINIGSTREIIETMAMDKWDKLSQEQKEDLRDSIRLSRGLSESTHIYRTKGKENFYDFEGILSMISEGTKIFEEESVDPWYAQAILMIESPGRTRHSPAGAYGAFQLMPGVARKFGLRVNRSHDDRKNFDKSAKASAQLIATICIPEAKKILDNQGISYSENALWFRLFVLHVYNAGAYNVAGVVQKINPSKGGMPLIQAMWTTRARRFGNSSQNYSQVALAALVLLKAIIQS